MINSQFNYTAHFALLNLQFALVQTVGALNYVEFRAATNLKWFVARLEGFEPTTYGLEVRSSIHLSYRRLIAKYTTSLSFGQGQIRYRYLSSLSYWAIWSLEYYVRSGCGDRCLDSFS